MGTTIVRLDAGAKAALERIMKATGQSKSAAIRQAALEAAEQHPHDDDYAAKAARFAGIIKDVPSDLSQNVEKAFTESLLEKHGR